MSSNPTAFEKPNSFELMYNRAVGFLVGLGLGFRHNYLLQVPGRKSGKLYSTPVDVLSVASGRYLVAPRGNTQWVRNALAAGRVTLRGACRARSLS